jgi:hypothetical protein
MSPEKRLEWRTLLAAMSGLLVTLPLAWLFYVAMFGWGARVPTAQGKTSIPMLSPEERRSLLTYGHHCETDTDCEPPLRCFFSTHTMNRYCTDSRCVTDMQCKDGFTCRPQAISNGDSLRVCSLVGARKEGERCLEHAPTTDWACEKGLLCNSRCGRPCKVDDPSSCPEGFFCHSNSEEGPSCLPTCEGRTCAEGQRCVALDTPALEGKHASICASVLGQDCKQNPCPQGQRCRLYNYPEPATTVWMECLAYCGADVPPCPEGTVCHMYQCHKSCTPEDRSSCAEGFVCHRKASREPWRCVPAPRASSEPSP